MNNDYYSSVDYSQPDIKQYPFARWHVFVIGFFLGHPITSAVREKSTELPSLWMRLVAVDFFIVAAIATFLFSYGSRGIKWPRYSKAFVCFWISCILSVLLSPYLSIPGAFKLGMGEVVIYFYLFIFSVVMYNFFLNDRVQSSAIWGVAIGCLLSAAIACSIKFLHFPGIHQQSRNLQGTFLNGAQFGHYLFYVGLMLFPLYLFKAKGLQKKMLLFVGLIIPGLLLLASKRAAMAAFGTLAILMVLYVGFIRRQFGKALIVSICGVLVFVIFYQFIFPKFLDVEEQEYFIERTQSLTGFFGRTNLGAEASSRQDFMGANTKIAVDFFWERPLSGIGIALGVVGPTHHELHNSYLKFLGEGGVFMVFAGIWFWCSAGFHGAFFKIGLAKRHLNLVNCYRLVFVAVLVINFWAYGIRRREVWFVLAFIEAIKATYYTDDTEYFDNLNPVDSIY